MATGLVIQALRTRPDAGAFLWLLAKVALIGISTLFLREWLMRLNDIVFAFADRLGTDPTKVDERFIEFLAGKAAASPKSSVWDVIWGTSSVGTAITYAFLWLFGWLSWGIQYIVKMIGGILLTAGWALSPLFLAFFMLRPMAGVAQRYLVGLVALVCWPFGWSLARNLPLVILGIGVMGLYVRDGRHFGQRAFFAIGVLMAVSYVCFAPVILFVQRFPMVGLLMIPKTVAYVAMGGVAYFGIFLRSDDQGTQPHPA